MSPRTPATLAGWRPVAARAALATAITALVVPWVAAIITEPSGVLGLIGFDFRIYLDATARWLEGGSFYLPHQLMGPYQIANGDVLYPPQVIYLVAPFLVLPGLLWWAVPLAGTVAALRHVRPSLWRLAGLVLCLLPPIGLQEILKGNPVMWALMFEALAVAGLPTGPLVAIKTSLLPFALVGVRRRGWWIVGGLSIVATLPLLGLMRDWLVAVTNSDGGPLYSIKDVPLMLVPLVAGVGRPRGQRAVGS